MLDDVGVVVVIDFGIEVMICYYDIFYWDFMSLDELLVVLCKDIYLWSYWIYV